jgi:hypothetical protein
MEFRFGTLADYAAPGQLNKLMIIGIFDTIYDRVGTRPIQFPPCSLVLMFTAHPTEGTEHRLELHFQNADGAELAPAVNGVLRFVPQGPGRELVANFIGMMPVFVAPDRGVYSFEVLVDGRHMGSVPVFVQEAPPGM